LEMNLAEEAKSIEKYAEQIQIRHETYEQEEDLRLRIIQKSLDQPSTSARNLSDHIVSFEEWSHRKHMNSVYPSSSPSISSKNRKSVKSPPGEGKEKNPKQPGGGGLTVDVNATAGDGTPSTPKSSSRLKKTDSFKKKLRESYFIHHKHSPKNHMRVQQSTEKVGGGGGFS
jgi:hypothetical protein